MRRALIKAPYRALVRLGLPGRVALRVLAAVARPVAKLRTGVARVVLAVLPDQISVRLLPRRFRYDAANLPTPISAPGTPIRLLIAPANYAAQGFAWARAVEKLDGVGAVNMQAHGAFGFPADYSIPVNALRHAYHWSRDHRAAVTRQFTHVLVEAELPILGRACGLDIRRDVAVLREAGIAVAFVSHGSDLRRPSRHALIDEWSPFADPGNEFVRRLEDRARASEALLDDIKAPVFVVTPELLVDRPDAIWLPNVVDPARWKSSVPPLRGPLPRVLHAPTHGELKGSALIEPVAYALHEEGLVEYLPRSGVPSDEMPDLYRSIDVVLEQFRLGIYSTTAIEAMAAGRVVVGYLRDQVRDHVRGVSGLEVPVVQATPATLDTVLRDIVARPDHYREIAAQGPEFVRALHDGGYSAKVLAANFLMPKNG